MWIDSQEARVCGRAFLVEGGGAWSRTDAAELDVPAQTHVSSV